MAGAPIPKLLGRFSITSTSDQLTVNAAAITLTTGDYFMRGYTAESTDQLVEHLQAQIRAAGGALAAFSVSLSDAGFITLSNGSAFTVTWNSEGSSALRNLLGFTGNLSSATSHTGSNQVKYCWFPNCGVAETQSHQSVLGASSSDAVVRRAPSGRVITTTYDTYREQMFEWRWLEDEYVWPVGVGGTTVTNRDFLQFWTDVIRIGQRFRYFPDRTSNTSTAYYEYVGGEKITKDGMEKCRREVASFSKYWKFDMDCLEYVSS